MKTWFKNLNGLHVVVGLILVWAITGTIVHGMPFVCYCLAWLTIGGFFYTLSKIQGVQ